MRLGSFAAVAAAIGVTEELVYRGYVQGRLRALGPLAAAILAAVGHTAYKCALFALPPLAVEIDLPFLALGTLVVGVGFGALRERSRSVLPALAAHACFDVLVYGQGAQAPWWVWS